MKNKTVTVTIKYQGPDDYTMDEDHVCEALLALSGDFINCLEVVKEEQRIKELEAEEDKGECVWSAEMDRDVRMDTYTTACGKEFMVGEDSQNAEEWMSFCCFCGKTLKVIEEEA